MPKRKKISLQLYEHDEQCMVMDWWSKQYPKHYGQLFSIPNSANLAGTEQHRINQMKRMKAEGLRPGAADLFLAIPRHGYHGFFIEMKRTGATESDLRANQIEFINDMTEYGYKADWCAGWQEAIKEIKKYMQ